MYKCDICGRELKKKISLYGYCLCSKHMHQLLKYGKFLDNIQRTNSDLNDYTINYDTNTVTFNLYNQKNVKNGEFIIDFDDIEKVKYHKWRISHDHVVTGLPSKGTQKDLSWIIIGITREQIDSGYVVDHTNCNAFDNRKCNLRICTQGQNVLNKSYMKRNTSNFIGVRYDKYHDRYDSEIRLQEKRCHLGYEKELKNAVYKRYYAEKLLFKEFANKEEQVRKYEYTLDLPQAKKQELRTIVEEKLKSKGLWQ